ncbi:epoxide hydrolase family protein [Acidisphaera rubrifaciens]|uniref:Epoxide hydrolase n=1 Tax=Acidisphaera rubrifaciens HS-AP3 TaxID=1231350 RepID=A0A0D6P7E3_9PROT|nr:epoxide hydrolase family protein [Acidisphaera rubrifaciens]GAN76789.1 epoxide hydrolase [Acidisphaera rubrifaciens HS-AP3]
MPDHAVTPFRIDVAQAVIDAIRAKVRAYDWHEMPEIAPGEDRWAYGTDMRYLRALCEYWVDTYDWRAAEAALNAHPQFTAAIDGQTIHFLHVRGSGPGGDALLLTHGWPGSVYEFYGVIDRLAHPQRHGGDAAAGIDLVIPSLPGFGFSGKPSRPIGPRRIAGLWDRLMRETLGYRRYIAQGGDWGAYISGMLALDHTHARGGGCEAVHLNMFGLRPAGPLGAEEDRAWADAVAQFRNRESAYSQLQATKPQTLSYAMMGSPVGVAAWIVEKFNTWADTRGPDGARDIEHVFTKDQLLTNVMIYLVTRSFNTASWIYRGRADEGGAVMPAGRRVEVPTAIASFPCEIIPFPKRPLVETGYDVVRWTDFERGGHFAAMETGPVFADDVAAFVAQVRALRRGD